jgi:carbon-monoxide dehydrogenase small subunit
MKKTIELFINDRNYKLEVEANEILLDVLRERLGLNGTKDGCREGDCGACTVLVDGLPLNACMLLAIRMNGRRIETIEGLAQEGTLHPLQQAFVEHWGMQCGYCTPGVLMSAKALIDRNPHPDESAIRAALSGNLCRCTGYKKIVKAIQVAANEMNPGESSTQGFVGQ